MRRSRLWLPISAIWNKSVGALCNSCPRSEPVAIPIAPDQGGWSQNCLVSNYCLKSRMVCHDRSKRNFSSKNFDRCGRGRWRSLGRGGNRWHIVPRWPPRPRKNPSSIRTHRRARRAVKIARCSNLPIPARPSKEPSRRKAGAWSTRRSRPDIN